MDRASQISQDDLRNIEMVKDMRKREEKYGRRKPKRRRVAAFGVAKHIIYFVVTEDQKRKEPFVPAPKNKWCDYQFETMFRKW